MAVAGSPGSPSFEVRVLVLFVNMPSGVPVAVTITLKEQLARGRRVPPVSLIGGAVGGTVGRTVSVLSFPQTFSIGNTFWLESTNPSGSVSVNMSPVRVIFALGLFSVKVSVELAPATTLLGSNCLAIVGFKGITST